MDPERRGPVTGDIRTSSVSACRSLNDGRIDLDGILDWILNDSSVGSRLDGLHWILAGFVGSLLDTCLTCFTKNTFRLIFCRSISSGSEIHSRTIGLIWIRFLAWFLFSV